MDKHTAIGAIIIGGGLGGVAAALAIARGGEHVLLTEETDWLGGQMTTQAVPPDEHPWIESFGRTQSYAALREAIRQYYRDWYPLTNRSRALPHLNPGAGLVSPICHEPRVSAAVIDSLLAPFVSSGMVTVLKRTKVVEAESEKDKIRRVTLFNLDTGERTQVTANYYLDASETGDLLPLTGAEFVTGFESRLDTGEPEAPEEAQPLNVQAISWCFAIDHRPDEDHTIDRPDDYDEWRAYGAKFWPGPQLGFVAPHPHDLRARTHVFNPNPFEDPSAVLADQSVNPGSEDLWLFRRILARDHFDPPFASDISLVNWPMIDYLDGSVFGDSDEEVEKHLHRAKRLSLSFFYWLQTEAPRPDGGTGYPGLRLRPDAVGTADGFAKAPYHRESRRIVARNRVTANDFSVAARGDAGAVSYEDSVGIGAYRIDLHPSTQGDSFIDVPAHPFEIPLGSLLPIRITNLLAAAKNIGTTHISSGAYRVHPVEWNIGESAGMLALFCLHKNVTPHEVHASAELLREYQSTLVREGIELKWPAVAPW